MQWYFPKLNGGEEKGLNDAGIEMFRNHDALGRETCQNIGDARLPNSDEPAIATFEFCKVAKTEFPGFDEFHGAIDSCRAHILEHLKDGTGNEKSFFDTANNLLNSKTIPFLRIGDANTTGLRGSDTEKNMPFWRLIRGQGSSSLQGAGGGTYGIGQRAPFAYSKLRTIFYSTLTEQGAAFVGKSILASHPGVNDNIMRQPQGWWCNEPTDPEQGNWTTQRQTAQIPDVFRRDKIGTDLWLAGFEMPDWEQRIRHSVLRNFFAAIREDRLVLRLADQGKTLCEVTADNLGEELNRALDEAKKDHNKSTWKNGIGSSVYYRKALQEPHDGQPFTTFIPRLGSVRFYVYRNSEEADIPNRYCTMRTPRILVEEKGSTMLRGFAGVFICDSDVGNAYLSQLEGPEHNAWSIDSVRNWSEDERKAGRATLKSIRKFIRESLKEIRGSDVSAVEDIPDLGKFLPADEDDETANKAPLGTTPGEERTAEESGRQVSIGIKVKPPPAQPEPAPPGLADDEGKIDSSGSGGVGSGGGGSSTTTNSGGDKSSKGKSGSIKASAIRFRSFSTAGKYRLIITPLADTTGDLPVKAVAEDSNYDVNIGSANIVGTNEPLAINGSKIIGVNLVKNQRLVIDLTINGADSVCLTAGA